MEDLVYSGEAVPKGGMGRKARCDMATPLNGGGGKDHVGPGQVAWAGDDLSGAPAVALHDADGVAGVLDGVVGMGLEDEVGCGDALGLGDAGHDVGFRKAVIYAAGEDEARGNTALVLVNALGDAGKHCGWRIAVAVHEVAEDDDGIESVCVGVAGGRVSASHGSPNDAAEGDGRCRQDEADSPGETPSRGMADVVGGRTVAARGRLPAERSGGSGHNAFTLARAGGHQGWSGVHGTPGSRRKRDETFRYMGRSGQFRRGDGVIDGRESCFALHVLAKGAVRFGRA